MILDNGEESYIGEERRVAPRNAERSRRIKRSEEVWSLRKLHEQKERGEGGRTVHGIARSKHRRAPFESAIALVRTYRVPDLVTHPTPLSLPPRRPRPLGAPPLVSLLLVNRPFLARFRRCLRAPIFFKRSDLEYIHLSILWIQLFNLMNL